MATLSSFSSAIRRGLLRLRSHPGICALHLWLFGCIGGGLIVGIRQMNAAVEQMYASVADSVPATQSTSSRVIENKRTTAAGDPAHGRQLFNLTCFVCHGPTGAGTPGLGANLRESKFIASRNDDQLAAFIKVGRQSGDPNSVLNLTMPPNGGNPTLDEAGLRDLVSYLRVLQDEAKHTATHAAAR